MLKEKVKINLQINFVWVQIIKKIIRSLLPIYIIIKDAQLVLGASEIIYLFLTKRINDKNYIWQNDSHCCAARTTNGVGNFLVSLF